MIRLAELRMKNNLSQHALAQKLNMTQQRISAYENGIREPDLETLKQFADFFDVSIDYLLGKPEKPYINIDNEFYQSLGINKEEYSNLSEEAKKQIKEFIEFVEKKDKK